MFLKHTKHPTCNLVIFLILSQINLASLNRLVKNLQTTHHHPNIKLCVPLFAILETFEQINNPKRRKRKKERN